MVVILPQDPQHGFADPGRQAILNTAAVFAAPSSLAGRPAEAALALAQAEFLAVDLGADARWVSFSPIAATQYADARAEWRAATGIAPGAAPQPVVDGLLAARGALQQGDRSGAERALTAPAFPGGGAATLARLAALPGLPRTAIAASAAQRELLRTTLEPEDYD